jgi:PASTA domain
MVGRELRMVGAPAAAAIAVALLALPAPSGAAVKARQADSFVDSIGVNVHLTYSDTPYFQRFDAVRERLEELGIRHIRDGLDPESADQHRKLGELAAAGIGSTLILGSPAEGEGTPEELVSVVKNELSGDVDTVEGPNEYSTTSGDSEWVAHLTAYQQQLYEEVKGDPTLSSLPVIGPSLVHNDQSTLGDISGTLDYGNIHSYPMGEPPEHGLGSAINHAELNSGPKPIVATETGYDTALNWSGENPGVSEQAMATYVPRLFLEYFRWGIVRTFSYELVDEHVDEGEESREDHFGLLRNDLSEKPAFAALRNTIRLLEDPGPSFAPGALDYSLIEDGAELAGGESKGLHKVLLEKRDGTFYLALWRLSSVWNAERREPIASPPEPVTLEVRPGIEAAAEYQPNASSGPIWSVSHPTGPLTIEVGPQIVIVELKPGTGDAQPLPTDASTPTPEGSSPGRRCAVPRLKGRTLKSARRRLARSGCRVGRVHRDRHHSGRRPRVLRQSPRPGRMLSEPAKVNLTLG